MTHSPAQNVNTSAYGSEDAESRRKPVSNAVSDVVDQAQNTARHVSAQAKQGATSRLESQKERAVDSLMTVAQALRQTGQHLNEQDQSTVGTYVEKAADRVESLTNHLRVNDVTQLLAETQEFARRRPAMFVGVAVALGFAGGRFLMSSGQRAAASGSYDSPEPAARPTISGITGPTGSSAS